MQENEHGQATVAAKKKKYSPAQVRRAFVYARLNVSLGTPRYTELAPLIARIRKASR